jgi:hypothetical protein
MMARGKSINVKIATSKVIKALDNKLRQVKLDKDNEAVNEAKFNKLVDKYNKEVIKIAAANTGKWEDVRVFTRHDGKVSVDIILPSSVVLPTQPERDFEVINHWHYKEMVEEIENAIRILKMTDEEYVNTSTYNSVARYL